MKEIGEQLKQAREAMGITIEEVSEDIKLTPSQLKSIEDGDRQGLKDILNLKQLIKDYAKYLGLEQDEIEDKFNEFVFEYTSKIPLEEIAKANQQKKVEEPKKIKSPYTMERAKNFFKIKWIMIILIILFIIVIFFITREIAYKPSNIIDNGLIGFFKK